ncbi:protocadherin-23-like [Mizuhopecten yessoensis]|uniref:protocadherin-23-like n=1 Tax=Mizuhopecten yessoensis TaxID=6573 RepID=UPI000B457694|nr:protocadherin-23-like [Mizuhopecten yessoensis]
MAGVIDEAKRVVVVSAKFTASSVNVYNITASDPPDVDSSVLTFARTCSAWPFTLQPGYILNVTLAASLDYETVSGYNLTVIVNDGTEGSDSVLLQINVEDVSEPPGISSGQHNTTVTENGNGTLVFDGFSMTDEDAGDTLSISIVSGNADNSLTMSSSGIVYFNVDYVRRGRARIQATDSTMLTATTVLTITIEDANDNTPVLSSNLYVKGANETVQMGSTLFTVICSDADSGIHSEVEFGIIPSSSMPDLVTISQTGEVILKQSLIA